MVTETDAIKRLSDWFKQHGWIVYQDKKNEFDNLIFHVKGESKEKLDLIVSPNQPNPLIAIEVKSGDDSRQLSIYSKILTYFHNYNESKTFYLDDNEKILNLDYFVIGTFYSPDGHLKYKEPLHIDSPRGSKNKWTRLDAVDHGCCPKKEYNTTFEITRHGIWYNVNEKHRIYNTGIGTLLSTCLDDNGFRPGIHIKKPKNVWVKGIFKRYWRTIWIPF